MIDLNSESQFWAEAGQIQRSRQIKQKIGELIQVVICSLAVYGLFSFLKDLGIL